MKTTSTLEEMKERMKLRLMNGLCDECCDECPTDRYNKCQEGIISTNEIIH